MKVRIKFSKDGAVKFIGHLDMMRFFQKAIRRAEIDIAYSGGYSPHQIMSFAAPLSVGHTSIGEYFDIEVNSFTDVSDFINKLNAAMVDGIEVLDAALLEDSEGNAMASVAAASYLVGFRDGVELPKNWKEKLIKFYNNETIPVKKKTKKGEKEFDLKAGIYGLEIVEDEITMLLNASSSGNIKPSFVLETFFDTLSIQLPEFSLQVKRLETYKETAAGTGTKLVPLIWQ